MNWHIDQSAPGESSDASASHLLDALADARRRTVLRTLAAERRVSLDRLAAAVTASAADAGSPAQVRVRLVHRDLPKLADAGLLAVDGDAEAATIRPWPDLVVTVLDAVDDGPGD